MASYKPRSTPDYAVTCACLTYKLHGTPFVPDHFKPRHFVAPGGRTLTEKELHRMGATQERKELWPRAWAQKAGIQSLHEGAVNN